MVEGLLPFYFFVESYEKSEKKKKDQKLFVFIAFVLSLLSSIYSKFMNPNLLPWGGSSLPWHIEYVFVAMLWMFLGYLFRTDYEKKFSEEFNGLIGAATLNIYLMIRYLPFVLSYEIQNPMLNIGYAYVCELIGVLNLVYISKRMRPNKYMLYIGQNTLICFALHGKIYSLIQTVLKKFAGSIYSDILSNMLLSSVLAVIIAFILSVVLIAPIFIINRWFPFLVGRVKKNRAVYHL